MHNRSETISKLAVALVAAQSEMKDPAFDAINPHFKNRYASLKSVKNAVLPVLNRHGIAAPQFPISKDNGEVGCETLLQHVSGEWMSQEFTVKPTKQDAQGAGSALTYTRRYSLQSVAGVVADEDDDANGAVQKPPEPSGFITEEQVKEIEDLVKSTKSDLEKFLKHIGADKIQNIPVSKYRKAIVDLNRKVSQANKTTPPEREPGSDDDK